VAFCNQFNYVFQGLGFLLQYFVYTAFSCHIILFVFFCLGFCFGAFVLLGLHVNKYPLNRTELDPDYDGTVAAFNGDV
jgi:hypothetical protein